MLSLHMYDLPNAVQFSSVESYVDDTKIFLSFSSKDVDLSLWRETLKTTTMLPSSAAQINRWLILAKPNSLCFEPDSFWRKSGKLVTWVYPFFGQALVPVSSVKYLRIVLNSHWTFNEHFTCITSSRLSTLCQISWVRYLFSRPVLILNSLVLTKLFCYTFLGWYHQAKPTKVTTGVKLCCSSCD